MPELGRVGRDVLTIVILTRRLLWRELITCDYFTKLLTCLTLTLRNDLCGTGANKPTVKSKPCTHIRYNSETNHCG